MAITITPELLAAAMGCTASVAHVWANALDDACDTYTIDTPERMAPFFAQLGEESSALSVLVESLNYTPERLLVVFGEHRISAENAQRYGRTADHAADQEAIANIVYGGEWGREHLGNTHPGDGWKFRGRGPIQTSGRYNAARVTMRLREKFNGVVPDFEEQPELLEIPRWGALAAADYWADHGLNALADIGNFEGITKAINGGLTNQASRIARWHRAEKALQQLAPTRVPAPAPAAPTPEPSQPTEDDLQSGRVTTQPEKPMALQAFVIPAALELAKLIPRIGGLFASGSEVSQRNLKLAEMVVDTVVPAVGAANAQEAVERIKADPQALKQASQAIDENWFRLEDVREKSVAAAREMYATRDRIVLANMVFHEVLALVIVCMTAAGMTAAFIGGDLSQSTKDNIVMLGLVGGFIGIKEFFFGGSRGSDTKTAIMERR